MIRHHSDGAGMIREKDSQKKPLVQLYYCSKQKPATYKRTTNKPEPIDIGQNMQILSTVFCIA